MELKTFVHDHNSIPILSQGKQNASQLIPRSWPIMELWSQGTGAVASPAPPRMLVSVGGFLGRPGQESVLIHDEPLVRALGQLSTSSRASTSKTTLRPSTSRIRAVVMTFDPRAAAAKWRMLIEIPTVRVPGGASGG